VALHFFTMARVQRLHYVLLQLYIVIVLLVPLHRRARRQTSVVVPPAHPVLSLSDHGYYLPIIVEMLEKRSTRAYE
jgi:hypothetical protein